MWAYMQDTLYSHGYTQLVDMLDYSRCGRFLITELSKCACINIIPVVLYQTLNFTPANILQLFSNPHT